MFPWVDVWRTVPIIEIKFGFFFVNFICATRLFLEMRRCWKRHLGVFSKQIWSVGKYKLKSQFNRFMLLCNALCKGLKPLFFVCSLILS